jgi:WD40 repeat protein/class 3 adenylate cyclase
MDTARTLTLVFTDLVNSTALKSEKGDRLASELIARHRSHVVSLSEQMGGRIVDWAGDGSFLTFETPSTAVLFALRLQQAHALDRDLPGVRIGLHTGEVSEHANPDGNGIRIEGLAVDTAARLQALAAPAQILLTAVVFDNARQRLHADDIEAAISWRAHGAYELKGIEGSVDVCEVGIEGISPLAPPAGSEKAHRAVSPGEEDTLGWRPAVGLRIPRRDNWNLQSQLGEGGFGEVWLAAHAKTKDKRVFKFCFEPERVRGLKREVVLFRLLKETLGNREDIAQILDWDFEHPPYFIESEYTAGGDLKSWAGSKGGLSKIPLPTRLEIVAQTAVALGAAHSVGILHKDLKPGNILVSEVPGKERPRVSLTDFGIGLITDPNALAARGITATGLTETLVSSSTPSSGAGTRMYMAPELIEGKQATTLSDVYALGVVLYQIVVGDFGHALAPGWERYVDDPLLAADIAACVDGNPERRLPGAADLASRLRSIDKRRADLEEEERLRLAVEKGRRRRRQFTAASLIGVTLTLLAAGFAYRENQRANDQTNLAASERLARIEAETARQEADAARAAEAALRDQAEYSAYLVAIKAADRALAISSDADTREMLARIPPDRRGWEWGYLVNKAFEEEHTDFAEVEPDAAGLTAAERWANATVQLAARLRPPVSGTISRFAPEGDRLFARGTDGTISVWDMNTFLALDSVSMMSARVTNSFSLDNATGLAALVSGYGIDIVDLDRREVVTRLEGLGEIYYSNPHFSHDSSIVLAKDVSQRLFAWDLASSEVLWTRQLPEAYMVGNWSVVECIGLVPGMAQMYLATDHPSIEVIDLASGESVRTIPTEIPVGFVPYGISRNGLTISYFDPDNKSYLLADCATGRPFGPPWVDSTGASPVAIVPSPDGTAAVVTTSAAAAHILFADPAYTPLHFALPAAPSLSLPEFSPDGRLLAITMSEDGSIAVLAPQRASPENQQDPLRHTDTVGTLRFLGSDDRLAAATFDGAIRVIDLKRRELAANFALHGSGITEFVLSPDQSRWLTHSYDGTFALTDARTGEKLFTSPTGVQGMWAGGLRGPLVRVVLPALPDTHFSPDGSRLVISDQPNGALLIDSQSLEIIHRLEAPDSVWAYRSGFSPDGKLVYTQGQEPVARVWDAQTGALKFEARAEGANILGIEFSLDSKRLFTTATGDQLTVWDCQTGERIHQVQAHSQNVLSIRTDPAGRFLLTTSTDGSAALWDAESYELLARFTGHGGFVMDGRFQPNGDRILTISLDGIVRVWDRLGNELIKFSNGDDHATYAAWSPSGDRIAVGTIKGNIHIYDSIPAAELRQEPGQRLDDAVNAWRTANR